MPHKSKKLQTIALLVAGGRSERMRGGLPKPYLELGGMSVLRRTIKTFLEHPEIDGVRVVIRREHHAYYKKAIGGLALIPCVIGGNSRQESVRLGLESIEHFSPEYVLIHDVARPLVSKHLISRITAALRTPQTPKAVIPVLPIADTVKRLEDGAVSETVSREGLVSVQTPQGFDYQTLLSAHLQFLGAEFTDDATVCEANRVAVFTVEGEISNYKITNAGDIKQMENSLSINSEIRTGLGYDVHRLVAHDIDKPVSQQVIKICGVRIPFTHHLLGHSDADVGLHSLVDAILGAISYGDIGLHFPPEDPKWQGASSDRFLLHAFELLKNRGGELVNMDITIICEQPKITPHRNQMREHIANLLKIDIGRISVKATTTERLGFTGREEGIAAQAIVNVRLPRGE
jgi:2-C-methyl-D-erythritol 4-phosphate cytidylyltransferase/2-C-methyl-D-erythritol 2,4-cyclodiphosphate synthase